MRRIRLRPILSQLALVCSPIHVSPLLVAATCILVGLPQTAFGQQFAIEQFYGNWAVFDGSDLCPPTPSGYWIFRPGRIQVSGSNSPPLSTQYSLSGDRLTMTSRNSAMTLVVPYRIIDVNTLQDLRPEPESAGVKRRCQPLQSSNLLSCTTKLVAWELLLLPKYFGEVKKMPADVQAGYDRVMKLIDSANPSAGDLNDACAMLKTLKVRIAGAAPQ